MADKLLCVDDDPSILAAYRMLQGQQRPAGEAFLLRVLGQAGHFAGGPHR